MTRIQITFKLISKVLAQKIEYKVFKSPDIDKEINMFPLKFLNVIETLKPKKNKSNLFEPTLNKNLSSPGEIRQSIKNMSRCSHCHFLIFDNYWSSEVQKSNVKVCPTCGYKL